MTNQSGRIQTVRGLIEPGELGPTLMHEHVVTDYTPPAQRDQPEVEITLENHFELSYHWVRHPGMRRLSDREVATREMQWMVQSGGCAVVDVSTRGMVLFPERLRDVSERSGAEIIMGCGRYYDDDLVDEAFPFDRGCLLPLDRPGLGIAVNPRKLERYREA